MMASDRLYLLHIQERIRRIEAFLGGQSKAAFEESLVLQDAVCRNFEIIGEATKRLSDVARAEQPHIPWRRISGFRDVLIHSYDTIDLDEVWKIYVDDLPPLKSAIDTLLIKTDTPPELDDEQIGDS